MFDANFLWNSMLGMNELIGKTIKEYRKGEFDVIELKMTDNSIYRFFVSMSGVYRLEYTDFKILVPIIGVQTSGNYEDEDEHSYEIQIDYSDSTKGFISFSSCIEEWQCGPVLTFNKMCARE